MNDQDALYSLIASGELLTANGLEDLENGDNSMTVNTVYVCEHCNKVFLKNSNYQTHLRTHTGEKPFVCCICTKQFARADYLKAHLVSHSGARPYTCGICEKTFTHVSSLNTHIRIHTGERPYACQICPRSFTKSSDLQRHLDIHREKLYTCFMCDKKFARIITLRKHLERCGSNQEGTSVDLSFKPRGPYSTSERKRRGRRIKSEYSEHFSSDEDHEPPKKKRPLQNDSLKNGNHHPNENKPPAGENGSKVFIKVVPPATIIPSPENSNGFMQNSQTAFDPTKTTFLIIPGQQNSFLVGAGDELFKSPSDIEPLPLQELTFDLGSSNAHQHLND